MSETTKFICLKVIIIALRYVLKRNVFVNSLVVYAWYFFSTRQGGFKRFSPAQ
jgi:hypothetical protein